MKNKTITCLLFIGGLCICLAAEEIAAPKFSRPREITNPFLPLASLKQDILESKDSRIERTAKPEVHKTFKIGDQTVDALAIEDREFEDGQLAEVTLDYFAQSDAGDVYYLGEDVDEYKDGKIVGHSGGWLLGKDTQHPGLIMPAHPRVGDTFKSENVPKITWEQDEVTSLAETVAIKMGNYQNCLKIKEKTSDGDVEYKYYVAGIGCVIEEEKDGKSILIKHETLETVK